MAPMLVSPRAIKEGRIPAVRPFGRRAVRVRLSDVTAIIDGAQPAQAGS